MNILITSVGTRTQLIEYFKREFKNIGKIIVTDCDELAPALYHADRYYIVPRITDDNYIKTIKDICKKDDIRAILSLIDPELSILAKYKDELESELNLKVIVSDYSSVVKCYDKYKTYQFLRDNNFKYIKTYRSKVEFINAYNNGDIDFPIFIKPTSGSGSVGSIKVESFNSLVNMEISNLYIIQEYLDGIEYSVDAYIDILNKKVTSIFIKEKVCIRCGEAVKTVSVKDNDMFTFIHKFINSIGLIGPVDMDVFKVNGEYYISDVNPRFGGAYPYAYECGENFPKYILNNLINIDNKSQIGNYQDSIHMMKSYIVTTKQSKDIK